MKKLLSAFAADESGATAIEYGALVAFIAVAVVLVVESIGVSIQGTFLEIKASFTSTTTTTTAQN